MLKKVIYSALIDGLYNISSKGSEQNEFYVKKEVEKARRTVKKFKIQLQREDVIYSVNSIYRLVMFVSYKFIEDEKFIDDVLKAMKIDEQKITDYVNNHALRKDILDIDKGKTAEESYIELISTIYLFGEKTENIIKTSGYTPSSIFDKIRHLHIAELIFLSGVLEAYVMDKRGIKMLILNMLKK